MASSWPVSARAADTGTANSTGSNPDQGLNWVIYNFLSVVYKCVGTFPGY